MKLSIGIVGLPNVGKSTLFRLLTKQAVNVANYPFATIDPNVGIVPVPDERRGKLSDLSKSKKTIPAVVEFYDIAGLVRGASKGEGLGNQFLSHIKEVNAIAHLLRCFPASDIVHIENRVDPLADLEIIHAELSLKDLEAVEKAIGRAESDARGGKKEAVAAVPVLLRAKQALEQGRQIVEYANDPAVQPLNLLMAKRQLYLLNGSAADVPEALTARIKALGGEYIIADLAHTDAVPEPRRVEVGAPTPSGASELIRAAYRILDLISFFTTGEDETRAWTTVRGALAPEAAGEIHSDFEEKFIRAEVIEWEKLVEAGGWSAAKAKGWLRLEGKDYAVKDGDVIVVRHG